MLNFWKRQFVPTATPYQRFFDFLFGIVAPWFCVFFDPIVFHAEFGANLGMPVYSRIFSYAEIAIGTAALAYCLLARRSSPFLAGVFFAGALFSFALGIAILPLTLLGLLLVIGVFGLMPFVTAFVFFRNGVRSWRQSTFPSNLPANLPPLPFRGPSISRPAIAASLGAVLMFGIPTSLQVHVLRTTSRAIAVLESGSDSDCAHAIETLKHARFVFNSDDLAYAYERAQSPVQRERIARAFLALTGKDVNARLAILHD